MADAVSTEDSSIEEVDLTIDEDKSSVSDSSPPLVPGSRHGSACSRTDLKDVKVVLEKYDSSPTTPNKRDQRPSSRSSVKTPLKNTPRKTLPPLDIVSTVSTPPKNKKARTTPQSENVTCRTSQFRLLNAVIGNSPTHNLPGTLFLWGASAAGKLYTLEKVLEGKENIHMIKLHCSEIICGRRALFETFIKQLVKFRNRPLAPNFKCDTIRDFNANIFDFMHDDGTPSDLRVIAIIQAAEALKGEYEDILRFFSSLGNTVKSNICVAILSILPPAHYMPFIMEHSFLPINFPQYTAEELIEIMKCTPFVQFHSEKTRSCYEFYVQMIVNVFFPVCRDIRKLIRLAKSHWAKFEQMVEESEDMNRIKLWKNLEPKMRAEFFELNSAFVSSTDAQRNQENLEKFLNLPLNAKYLVIASYLATHNPPTSDKRFFVKSAAAKKSRKVVNVNSKTDANSKPFLRSFELNRLTAIFTSVQDYCDEKAMNKNRNVGFMTLITTLCQNKVIQHLGEDSSGNVKYKCLLDYDAVLDVSRSVDFELNNFLYRLS